MAKKQPDGGGGYHLRVEDSDKLSGLKVTCRDENGEGIDSEETSSLPPVIVGTIRMGFGHHRIAYAAASWGLNSDEGRETWFHDFLNIDSEEAQMIKDTDKLYSKGSRLASEVSLSRQLSFTVVFHILESLCSHDVHTQIIYPARRTRRKILGITHQIRRRRLSSCHISIF